MNKNNGKLSPRLWIGMLMCSFIGGLAWNVENMYFNTDLTTPAEGPVQEKHCLNNLYLGLCF